MGHLQTTEGHSVQADEGLGHDKQDPDKINLALKGVGGRAQRLKAGVSV